MTTPEPLSVVLIDDDDDLRHSTQQLLAIAGYPVSAFGSPVEALATIDANAAGLVIADVRMPQMTGLDVFRILHERDADLPVLLISGHADVETAVGALKAGAWDFIEKPFDPDVLLAAVARAVTARGLTMENRALRRAAEGQANTTFVGDTAMVRRLRAMIPVLGESDIDLVIEGQTGTGKELYARCVHRAGPRSRHRFLAIDCAAISPALIERDLFARGGIIARANRGTLFLDNLDSAGEDLQRRLAQFAEQRASGLDTLDPEAVNVRIIASIDEGGRSRLSDALYHRIAGVPVRLPPLTERRKDVPLLFAHLLRQAAERLKRPVPQFDDALLLLEGQEWPGNVRELEKLAERWCLGLELVPTPETPSGPTLPERIDAFERAAIHQALRDAQGEIARAIALLGVPRKTFYYRVKRLGIDLRSLRASLSRGR